MLKDTDHLASCCGIKTVGFTTIINKKLDLYLQHLLRIYGIKCWYDRSNIVTQNTAILHCLNFFPLAQSSIIRSMYLINIKSVISTKCTDEDLNLVLRRASCQKQRTHFTVHHDAKEVYKEVFWSVVLLVNIRFFKSCTKKL